MKRIAMAGAAVLAVGAIAVGVPAISNADVAKPTAHTESFAISHADAAVNSHAGQLAAGGADRFSVRSVVLDRDGASHVRYDRTYQGLPVLGGDVVVHLDKAGGFKAGSHGMRAPLNLSTAPTVSSTQAATLAGSAYPGSVGPAKLVVDAGTGTPKLAWHAVVSSVQADGTPSEMNVLIDARTGATLDAWDSVETATGNGYYVGPVTLDTTGASGAYQLKDPTRGNSYTTDMNNGSSGSGTLFTDADNVWGDGTLSSRQSVAVDAQYGVAKTWDYYKNVHARNGIFGNGSGSYNRVHYGNRYNNASWSNSCNCMTYGDGDGTTFGPFTALDVAGHEMSHGVTSRTSNLRYSGESGGLNEATSDIFGSMVEFYAGNAKDTPDYLIGEKVRKNGQPLRWMDDPAKDGRSARCWSSSVGSLNVHYSSGVGNHFFFLLAVGSGARTVNGVAYNSPTCNGSSVTGIGNAAAEKIWYRALTVYMTSTTNYAGARTATLRAATDLYGSGSTQYNTVAVAWSAVSVG